MAGTFKRDHGYPYREYKVTRNADGTTTHYVEIEDLDVEWEFNPVTPVANCTARVTVEIVAPSGTQFGSGGMFRQDGTNGNLNVSLSGASWDIDPV